MTTDTRTPAEILVDEVLAAQRAKGRAKYGRPLDHTEPRDWNRMALEETVDAVQYLAAENRRLAEENARLTEENRRLRGALQIAISVLRSGALIERRIEYADSLEARLE